jgi:hypothetical protein
MQNWERHIERVLSDLRNTEVLFGIEQRIIARLSMKPVIHLVRANVDELDRFKTRAAADGHDVGVQLVLLPAPSWELFTDVDYR